MLDVIKDDENCKSCYYRYCCNKEFEFDCKNNDYMYYDSKGI